MWCCSNICRFFENTLWKLRWSSKWAMAGAQCHETRLDVFAMSTDSTFFGEHIIIVLAKRFLFQTKLPSRQNWH
jgi:hypothetical protein